MPKVIYSPDADLDLDEIWHCVADNSQIQADRLIEQFRFKLDHLAKWNTMGRPRPELSKGCRSFPFGKYCFYFRPMDDGIEVLRILHSARDLNQIEFPE